MDEPLIINLADAPALSHPRRATIIDFGSDDNAWPDTGVNVQIMQPGQPNCRYHSEPVQEDFLVLHGDCIAIVNGEERPLKQWDFFPLSGRCRARFRRCWRRSVCRVDDRIAAQG